MPHSLAAQKAALIAYAMTYPESSIHHPWDETVVKVRDKKIFVFFGMDWPDKFIVGVKLPESQDMALLLPCVEPAGYGLGKSGWVMATITKETKPEVPLLKAWIDESYRAVAPKKLVAALGRSG